MSLFKHKDKCVFLSQDLERVDTAKSMLMKANIKFKAKNEYFPLKLGLGQLGGVSSPTSEPVEILVNEEDEKEAKALLENLE